MAKLTTLFWDVGGVLLTNGWDAAARRRAAERYSLDWDDLQQRHHAIIAEFEEGRVSLDEYLDAAVFWRPRPFMRNDFRDFMFSQSHAKPEGLKIVETIAGMYFLSTLNNESYELNVHRIERYGLRKYFTVFFSSSFLGVRKPDPRIYRAALQITQRKPEECLYIDDREPNLEPARRLGLATIHFQSADQCRRELSQHGVQMDHSVGGVDSL